MKDEHPDAPRKFFFIICLAVVIWLVAEYNGKMPKSGKANKDSVEAHVLSFIE
ncbi:MAG TPA: hypothetical protein PKD34_01280 [Candidatus Doudnabacteria bacterium]|nr:hypothetical protein [Candidatus Doudnabacteria bacterium]